MQRKTFLKTVMLLALFMVGTTQLSAQGFLKKLQKTAATVGNTLVSDGATAEASADTTAAKKVNWDKLPQYSAYMMFETDSITGDTVKYEDGTMKYYVILMDQFGNRRTPETVKSQQKIVNDAVTAILVKVGSGALMGGLSGGLEGAAKGAAVGAVASSYDIKQATQWKKVLRKQKKLLESYEENYTSEGLPKDSSVSPESIPDLNFDKANITSANTKEIKEQLDKMSDEEISDDIWESLESES